MHDKYKVVRTKIKNNCDRDLLFDLAADKLELYLKDSEVLLLNCFGAEYMSVTSKVVTLEWLHSTTIRENFEKSFHVKL